MLAGGIAGETLKVTSDTGVEWREIATNTPGSNQLTVAAGNAVTDMDQADLHLDVATE